MTNYNLNQVAINYENAKKQLIVAKGELEKDQEKNRENQKKLKIEKTRLTLAKLTENDQEIEIATKNIRELKEILNAGKTDFKNKLNQVVELNNSIEEIKQNVMDDPQMGQVISDVLQKRFDRQIQKNNNKIAENNKKQNNLNKDISHARLIRTLCENNLEIANYYKGLLNAKAQINKLNSELETTSNANSRNAKIAKIVELNQKYNDLKEHLLSCIQKSGNKSFTKESIDETINMVMENGIVSSKTNNEKIDLSETFEKTITNTQNEVKELNDNSKILMAETKKLENAIQGRDTAEKDEVETESKSNLPTKPIAKWRFIRRFINFVKNKTNRKKDTNEVETENEEHTENDLKDNPFRNSLRNATIRDMVKDIQNDRINEANKHEKDSQDKDGEGR